MASSSQLNAAPSVVAGLACSFCRSPSPRLQDGWPLHDGRRAALCGKCAFAYEKGTFCSIFHANHVGWDECGTCKTIFHSGCLMSSHLYDTLKNGKIRCSRCSSWESLKATKTENPLAPFPRSNAEVILLFEKKLTWTDASSKNGRMIIKKEHGKMYFPDVGEGEGIPIKIFDSKGYEWNVGFRCWKNSRMRVLEGLRDFKKMWELQRDDIVSFYRIEKKIFVDVTRPRQLDK